HPLHRAHLRRGGGDRQALRDGGDPERNRAAGDRGERPAPEQAGEGGRAAGGQAELAGAADQVLHPLLDRRARRVLALPGGAGAGGASGRRRGRPGRAAAPPAARPSWLARRTRCSIRSWIGARGGCSPCRRARTRATSVAAPVATTTASPCPDATVVPA